MLNSTIPHVPAFAPISLLDFAGSDARARQQAGPCLPYPLRRRLDVRVPEFDIALWGLRAAVAKQAGFHFSKRPPLSGAQKAWETATTRSFAVIGNNAIREWMKDKELTDLSAIHW
ncbi:MAG: hypothetical protein OXN84_04860 [Albidovulum sp.]|nr:hypothetical protein [Albidovulum sp.]